MDTASLTVAPVHQNHRQQTVHTRDHSQPVGSRKDRREGGREGRRDEEGDVGENEEGQEREGKVERERGREGEMDDHHYTCAVIHVHV